MEITEEMIRTKAYELWVANGRPLGSAEANWFAAQSLLIAAAKTSSKNQSPPNGLRQLTPS